MRGEEGEMEGVRGRDGGNGERVRGGERVGRKGGWVKSGVSEDE